MKVFNEEYFLQGEAQAYEILHKAVNEVFENYETIPYGAPVDYDKYLNSSCEKLKKMVAIMIDNQKKNIIEVSKL